MNREQAEAAVSQLLTALGYDPQADAIRDTPKRVAKAWGEMLAGQEMTAEEILSTTFEADHDEVVLCRRISFWSTCEHHLLPFHGVAAVAYIPGSSGRVVGLSKLARLVEMHARRLQLQERMTRGIATDLERCLSPVGVGVVIRAQHLCMAARGAKQHDSEMVTSVMLGAFRDDASARAELLSLIR
jgi:GTP cyclohydrolase I